MARKESSHTTVRTSLISNSIAHRRANTGFDFNIKNCYIDSVPSGDEEKRFRAKKRHGLSLAWDQTDGTGRGIYAWNGNVYYVIGTTLYKESTSLGSLTGSGGVATIQWSEIQGGEPRLIIKDGDEIYTVNISNTIVRVKTAVSITGITLAGLVATATVASTSILTIGQAVIVAGATQTEYNGTQTITGIPSSTTFTYNVTGSPATPATGTITYTPFVPTGLANGLANLDGYLFVSKSTLNNSQGIVSHTRNTNNPTQWDLSSVITPSQFPDETTGLIRYLNYLVAFGRYSTEFFYNAGNSVGSVLAPVEGATLNFGCPDGNLAKVIGGMLFYVAQDQNGNRSVIRIRGLDWEIISNPIIDRFLQNEGIITDCFLTTYRFSGHVFVLINLVSSDITLVWDDTMQSWYQWSFFNGTTESYFKLFGTAEVTGNVYILHQSTGTAYLLSDTDFQDNSQNIKVKIVTNKQDFGTKKLKYFNKLGFVGIRTPSISNVSIRYTDDDYNTFSTARTFDISKFNPSKSRYGHSIERAWEITHEANTDFFAEALEHDISIGLYAKGT